MTAHEMERFWDARAREDAAYFVDNLLEYKHGDMERFWAGGEDVVDGVLARAGLQIGRDDTVAEIGCGLGRLTRVLAARADRVWAFDISSEMLRRAKELLPDLANVEWVHGDGVSLRPLGDSSVTCCFSFVVFQHLPDPELTLGYVREMGRVLCGGGAAVFQLSNDPSIHDPVPPSARRRLAALTGRAPRGQAHPAWRGSAVDLESVRIAAASAQMDVEHVEGAGTQFCLVVLRRL
jgi:SAM-dependent methyltransferase